VDRLLNKINSTGVTERPKGSGRPRSVPTSEFWEKMELVEEFICSHESALHVYKDMYEIGRKMDISRFGVLRSMIFGWKSTSACQGYCDSMAPLYFQKLFLINSR